MRRELNTTLLILDYSSEKDTKPKLLFRYTQDIENFAQIVAKAIKLVCRFPSAL